MEEDLKSASEGLTDIPDERPYQPEPPKRYRSKKPLIILAMILVLAGAAFAVKKYVLNKPAAAPATTEVKPVETALVVANDTQEDATLEDFASDTPRISFKYPKSWTVTEKDGGVRVESPEFTYAAIQEGDVTGNFRVYIRQGARKKDSPYIGRGVAIKPSEKFTYLDPAPGQRTTTKLSSFGYDSTSAFSYFLIAGNFQLKKGETLGPDYGKEMDTYLVIGGYSSAKLKDDFEMNSVEVSTYADTNAYKQGYAIIESLQLK